MPVELANLLRQRFVYCDTQSRVDWAKMIRVGGSG